MLSSLLSVRRRFATGDEGLCDSSLWSSKTSFSLGENKLPSFSILTAFCLFVSFFYNIKVFFKTIDISWTIERI